MGVAYCRWIWFIAPLPFAVIVFSFAEVKKVLFRMYPTGWAYQEFYY